MVKDIEELIRELGEFVTKRRIELFRQVLGMRTRYLTVVLEDIYQPHNASAVLRSCECFGIQDIHIIENKNEYRINPDVVMGASKWLNLKRYNRGDFNTTEAVKALRNKGYRIVATTGNEGSPDLDEFDLGKGRAALFFGTELTGLSEVMMEQADEFLKIPMYGFTDSFNISVSAAVILHHLTLKLHSSELDWKLSDQERDSLLVSWLQKSIKHLRGKSPEGFTTLD